MDRCPKCNRIAQPGDLFCGYCGHRIEQKKKSIDSTVDSLKLSDVQLSLGIVYLKKRQYSKAIEKIEKILEKNPEDERAQKLLAMARGALDQATKTSE